MANVNTIAFQSPQFSVISESQMKDLHLAALEVLRHTGIRLHHKGGIYDTCINPEHAPGFD